jgi:phosphoserine phosphatase
MKRDGAACVLVSGGFTFFSERIAHRLGFDALQANKLDISQGRLTGRVVAPILARDAKRAALELNAAQRRLPVAQTLAVGDGANDLAMLAAAGLGVAYRAKPKVVEQAERLPTGAVVAHGDLTALLYLQGYRRHEFAS